MTDVDVRSYLSQCGYHKSKSSNSEADHQLLYDIFTYLNNIPYSYCIIHAVSDTTSNIDVVSIYNGLSSVIAWLNTTVMVCQLFPALTLTVNKLYLEVLSTWHT